MQIVKFKNGGVSICLSKFEKIQLTKLVEELSLTTLVDELYYKLKKQEAC